MLYFIAFILAFSLAPVLQLLLFNDQMSFYELDEKFETFFFSFFVILAVLAIVLAIVGGIISSNCTPESYSYDRYSIVDIDISSRTATIVIDNKLLNVDLSTAVSTNEAAAFIVRKTTHLPSFVQSLFLIEDKTEYIYYYPLTES